MNCLPKIFLKSLIYSILAVNINLTYAQQKSQIYSPYVAANGLTLEEGYCKDTVDEKKLWLEINKYSKSVLQVFPQIPPEQKLYIKAELNSENQNRLNGIINSSFYKMNVLYESIENIEKISTLYVLNISSISLNKKMEFIGRILYELNNEGISYEQIDLVSVDLKRKNYFIDSSDLIMFKNLNYILKIQLIRHLICYGKK